jgi:hypothetical protein
MSGWLAARAYPPSRVKVSPMHDQRMSDQLSAWSMTVAMDYGQFSLSGAADDPSDAQAKALEFAFAGAGIGKVGETVVVLSPHQNNFQMGVTFELWTDAPADDLDEWQEAFEVSLDIDEEGLTYGSPTLEGETIALPSGHYGLRICGRGFVAHGWPGSTSPGDRWRWQFWRSKAQIAPRRLRTWAADEN